MVDRQGGQAARPQPAQGRAGAPGAVDGDLPRRDRRARDGGCGAAGRPADAEGHVRARRRAQTRPATTRTPRASCSPKPALPDGFGLTLHGPNDRYVNDEKVAQAIAQMLQRIGVQTTVVTMPASVYFGRANRLEFSLMFLGWGTDTGEVVVAAQGAAGDLRPRQGSRHGRTAGATRTRKSTGCSRRGSPPSTTEAREAPAGGHRGRDAPTAGSSRSITRSTYGRRARTSSIPRAPTSARTRSISGRRSDSFVAPANARVQGAQYQIRLPPG